MTCSCAHHPHAWPPCTLPTPPSLTLPPPRQKVSILKNLSNLFILVGDYVFFRRTYSWHVWACLAIMFVSVVTGAATDISFSLEGYAWQMVNNCFTAAYALYLSRVTEKLTTGGAGGGAPGEKGRGVNQLSMVYYNNVLSIPLVRLCSTWVLFVMCKGGVCFEEVVLAA